nr:histidine kinase [Gammaproteobacteria bacterium]
IAHEINTPTQYVSDNARFLRDAFLDITKMLEELRRSTAEGAPLPASELRRMLEEADADYLLEEIPRALDQSLDGLGRVTRIVHAMKAFSHPSLEEKVPADLNQALETTLIVASNEWKYVAEVTTALDPELPPVACFPGDLNQVFLNLIVNAAHAIAEVVTPDAGAKGRITVSTALLPDGNAEIRIADTGCGITDENRFKVFDPFFTTKGIGKGTGQGLAIAYNIIVKKHGGTIDFKSTPGQGTSFFIRLPIANGAFSSDRAPVP